MITSVADFGRPVPIATGLALTRHRAVQRAVALGAAGAAPSYAAGPTRRRAWRSASRLALVAYWWALRPGRASTSTLFEATC